MHYQSLNNSFSFLRNSKFIKDMNCKKKVKPKVDKTKLYMYM